MDIAISYIESVDTSNLCLSTEPISGDDVYYMLQNYMTKEYSDGSFETHDKYIDIQIILEGEEKIYYADRSTMPSPTNYLEDKDKTNYKDNKNALEVHAKPQDVFIFYPEDAHKACIKVGSALNPVKKLLLKVRV